jgi:UDP-N-acetylglucosamine--N-acetylmuramyl-(pentapeptide) pyrophosphoryl-undecaprenol N-acetylglucosamine transferase
VFPWNFNEYNEKGKSKLNRTIIIASGGTGGHISPGIALAEILIDKQKEINFENLLIHSLDRNIDNPDLKEAPCKVIWHTTPQFNKNPILFPFKFLYNIIKTLIQFRTLKVDIVIAMGGYSSLPSIFYAVIFRKRIFLCEQNRIMGKVNKWILPFAEKIAFSLPPINLPMRKNLQTKIIGNPTRKKIIPEIKTISSKLQIVSLKEKLNVLVMGGSQGARQINNMIISLMNHSEISKNFNFRLLTGVSLYDEAMAKTKKNAEIISYSEDMKSHYEWANLVIARSGAGVMILIPYPYSADNHQEENANYFEEHSAAWKISQKDEDISKLLKILNEIIADRNLLALKSESSLTISKPNAAIETVRFFFHDK